MSFLVEEKVMLLRELVEKGRVSFQDGFNTWEEAVQAPCELLLKQGVIEQSYVESIIECVKKYGPYIVFAPNIAMPHSQEGAVGVHETAVSFMRVKNKVHFEEGNPDKDAAIFFVLASKNHEEHMNNMEQLAQLLVEPGIIEKLMQAENEKDLLLIDQQLSS